MTPAALADLAEIRDHLHRTAGPDVAARVLSDPYDAMVNVASRPDLGHARPDLTTEPRLFFLVFRYLVIYRTDRPLLEVGHPCALHREGRSGHTQRDLIGRLWGRSTWHGRIPLEFAAVTAGDRFHTMCRVGRHRPFFRAGGDPPTPAHDATAGPNVTSRAGRPCSCRNVISMAM
jgi:plasmid stabilization system protein ParE